jgi:uncharacterized membrane protein
MRRLGSFVRTAVLGGFGVLLPILVFLVLLRALYNFVMGAIRPLTGFATGGATGVWGDVLSIAIVLAVFFVAGLVAKGKAGTAALDWLERNTLKRIPGYRFVTDTVGYFTKSSEESRFTTVALVRPFEGRAWQTAFVTDTNPDGSYTVFVPQSPNPLQGDNYHLPAEDVRIIDVPVDRAMTTVVGLGAGSSDFVGRTEG